MNINFNEASLDFIIYLYVFEFAFIYYIILYVRYKKALLYD